MNHCRISFIGGGNMARSLIGGLIAEQFPAAQIHVADTLSDNLATLHAQYGIQTHADNITACQAADIVILAVKPQHIQTVCKQLSDVWQSGQLLISIAAGIRLDDMTRWLGHHDAAIVRVMPNTPSLVSAGASALFANDHVSAAQSDQAEAILRAVGLTLWLKAESEMDAVTALSGSGPAYFFLVMEVMEKAAVELGLSPETARLLCLQTAFGAAKMALESELHASTLRQQVTSPGGTTERAISALQTGDLKGLFQNALVAAALRSRELADQFGVDHD